MFKKKFVLVKESLISSKDKKSLQNRLGDKEVFTKSSKLKQASVSGSKIKIYFEEKENIWTPILIENKILFPTIFSL